MYRIDSGTTLRGVDIFDSFTMEFGWIVASNERLFSICYYTLNGCVYYIHVPL